MSSDFSKSKKPVSAVFPERTIDASGIYKEVEALLDGPKMARRFFFGIPLTSPLTKEKLTSDDLNDYVARGLAKFQLDSKIPVQSKILRHRLPFDPSLYKQYIALEIPFKPIRRVLRLAICSASYASVLDAQGAPEENKEFPSGGELYRIPPDWVEMGNAHRGLLNVVPLGVVFSGASLGFETQAASLSGQAILQVIGQMGWLPAFWTVECETGLSDSTGQVPLIVNEAIGTAAALYLIDVLLPLYRTAAQSMSIDGLSQSINDRMIEVLQHKQQTLETRYTGIMKHLKTMYGNNFFVSNV